MGEVGGRNQKALSPGLIPRSSRTKVMLGRVLCITDAQTYHTNCPLLAKITYDEICRAGPCAWMFEVLHIGYEEI